MKRISWPVGLGLLSLLAACEIAETPTAPEVSPDVQLARAPAQANVGINVLLDRPATDGILVELSRFGTVTGRIDEIQAVFMRGRVSDIPAIEALPFVVAANPDAERGAGPPVPPVEVSDFAVGTNTWNLDAVDITELDVGRTVSGDGAGVYVGVLDTGLLDTWRYYFPEERIAVEHARSFTGGPFAGTTAQQPNKWEHDTDSHGTHVTSTILGYNLNGLPVNGSAPLATVIPVKVLNNNGSGWSSTISQGIVYIAQLRAGALGGAPVVINLSLSGPVLDAVERAAVDYAIANGVLVVASAGNRGMSGMGYPGGYAPVISVGAAGWIGEWMSDRTWWRMDDVPDPTDGDDFYVTSFSSRELVGQDLDVLAPGSWVVGPFQVDRGHTSYFFLGGTSMASPHVAGIVAMMAQANPGLTPAQAEAILESTAVPVAPGTATVLLPSGGTQDVTWGADATGSGLVSAPAAIAAAGP